MKIKELRQTTESELKNKMEDLKVELMKLKAQSKMGASPKSPGLIKKSKRTIARILTILNEKKSASKSDKKTKEAKAKE